ncbi:MAG: Mrp/NBP35 family ATP-binding protein [Planctomycetota bacterium]|nr:Mrp/NBP35 family ATP-binding protein [Planctomycetota bacterium]
MNLKNEHVMEALSTVQDPDLGRDLVTLGMVKDVSCEEGQVAIHVELTTPACPMKDRIRDDIIAAVKRQAASVEAAEPTVDVTFSASVRGRDSEGGDSPLAGVRNVIAVGAGKGGVGKSSVSVNLAIGLARLGARVGLLDGDIYGPSLETMLGLGDSTPTARGNMLDPFEVAGIKAMTIARLVDPEKPMIWRGPMAHKAFSQLLMQTTWGDLDYLFVDLPPGTGDVPLSLSQQLPLTGAVIVCTPQRVAQDDAKRAVRMFQQLDVRILGVVENMSWFIGDDDREYDLFGRGGAEAMAASMNLPFLGAVPMHMKMRVHADEGTPAANYEIDETITSTLEGLCESLAQQVSIATMSGNMVQPTISVR